MTREHVEAHWRDWARTYGADLRATTKTATIKRLEVAALARALRAVLSPAGQGRVLEVGCGNGHNLVALAHAFAEVRFTGVDYVSEMVRSAAGLIEAEGLAERVEVTAGDALALEDAGLEAGFDAAFTDRCLINLASHEEQARAFEGIVSLVRPGGRCVLIENSAQSHARQNAARTAVGLPPREPAAFNVFLDEEAFLPAAAQVAELKGIEDFASLHDLALYVLAPAAGDGEIDYAHPLVELATMVELRSSEDGVGDGFGSFGQNRLFVFERRAA